MITEAHIQNYMCLRDVTLRLSPMTILVGPNASGKSALLQALAPQIPPWDARWQRNDEVTISVSLSFDDGREDSVRGRKRNGSRVSEISNGLSGYQYQLLRLSPSSLRQPNKVKYENRLNLAGSNLTNLFYTIGRSRQAQVAQELSRLVPALADVDIRPIGDPGMHGLVFEDRWQPGLWYSPNQVSDGTMLVLAFVVLQHQDPPVELLCIEEPERGLHPYLLGEVVELLRKLAHGTIGPVPIQVVLATHSPELLDRALPEEVRFLDRDERDGAVTVREAPTDTPQWREAYQEYCESLGAAWLSGGLGGVPTNR